MITLETYPPEIYAALSLAAYHRDRDKFSWFRGRKFSRRKPGKSHEAKAMRLEARARRLAAKRGIAIEARI